MEGLGGHSSVVPKRRTVWFQKMDGADGHGHHLAERVRTWYQKFHSEDCVLVRGGDVLDSSKVESMRGAG